MLLGTWGADALLTHKHRYVQFAPLAYIVKLHIELTMAVLISKVARSGSNTNRDGLQSSSAHKTDPNRRTSRVIVTTGPAGPGQENDFLHLADRDVEARGGSSSSRVPLSMTYDGQGIVKTVEAIVQVEERNPASVKG